MNSVKYRQNYELLRNEYQICKQKLDSKCEALLILTKDLDRCRQERDQFKLMAEQVQQRYQALKRQLAGVGPRASAFEVSEYTGMKQQNLAQLLCEMRECNKSQQFETEDLRQKLSDAQGDIKLLREQIARQRVGTTDEGMNTRHFPAYEREDLVKQLEAAKDQVAQLERDLQQVIDEKEEQETERDVYKNKYERLNQELNYILKGEENRIVDIDALVMENKFLQQKINQMEEEKSMAMATVSKYKSLLERKKNKGIIKLGQSRAGGVVVSQKQVKELLHGQGSGSPTPQMLSDLQSLATALLETVNDKNLALQHQRKTNKILSERVSELEKKLKTLEVSGLWSSTGKATNLDKIKLECEEIKTLIPRQLSESSDVTSADDHCENSVNNSSCDTHVTTNQKALCSAQLSLEDLDFLPTKDIGKNTGSDDLNKGASISCKSSTPEDVDQVDIDEDPVSSINSDNEVESFFNCDNKLTSSKNEEVERELVLDKGMEYDNTAGELNSLMEQITAKVANQCTGSLEPKSKECNKDNIEVNYENNISKDNVCRSESPSDSMPLLNGNNQKSTLEESRSIEKTEI